MARCLALPEPSSTRMTRSSTRQFTIMFHLGNREWRISLKRTIQSFLAIHLVRRLASWALTALNAIDWETQPGDNTPARDNEELYRSGYF